LIKIFPQKIGLNIYYLELGLSAVMGVTMKENLDNMRRNY
jgi:hypothetical protein